MTTDRRPPTASAVAAALADGCALRRPARDRGRRRSCARCSPRRTGRRALETVAADEGVVADDRRPRARRPAGTSARRTTCTGIRFGGHEPLRPLVDHDPTLERWTCRCAATTPTRSPSGRSTPASSSPATSASTSSATASSTSTRSSSTSTAASSAPPKARRSRRASPTPRAPAPPAPSRTASPTRSACEEALGLVPDRRARAASRTILLELERVWNHLNDIAAICAGVGLAAGNNSFAALTERARRLNAALTGHRFLFDTVRVGGSDLALDADAARRGARRARRDPRSASAQLARAPLQRLLPGPAARTSASSAPPHAERLGAVGPAARAAGLAEDVRAEQPAARLRGLHPGRPRAGRPATCRRGSSSARSSCWQTFDAPRRAARPAAPARRRRAAAAQERRSASAASRARAGRRAASSSAAATAIERLRLRTGSYANWPVVAYAATDNLLPDFPLINKSFELCYACVDR